MGITNLLQILKSIVNKRHLRELAGKRLAIDAYVWLHKSAYSIMEGILENPQSTEYLKYLNKCVDHLLQYKIIPILVFDGDKLPMKELTENKREIKRESRTKELNDCLKRNDILQAQKKKIQAIDIDPQMAQEFIKVLKKRRIEYIVAPYEADVQLAYLSKINYVDGVITEDSDLLAFGCKRVLFKLDFQSSMCDEILYDNIKKTESYDFTSFNDDKFVTFCILCGCDYFKMKGVGPKNAYKALRDSNNYKEAFSLLRKKGSQCEKDTDEEFEKAFLAFHFQVIYCPIEKKTKYFNDMTTMNYPFMNKITDYSFLGTIYDDDTSQKIALGEINPITHKPFENIKQTKLSSIIFEKSSVDKPKMKKTLAKGKGNVAMKPGKKEYSFNLAQSKLPFLLKVDTKNEDINPNIFLKGNYVPTVNSKESSSTITTSNTNTKATAKKNVAKYGFKRKFDEFAQQSKEMKKKARKENKTIENSIKAMKATTNLESFLSSVYDFHQEVTPIKEINDNQASNNIINDNKPSSSLYSSKKSNESMYDYINLQDSIFKATPIVIKTKDHPDDLINQKSINRLIEKYTYDSSIIRQINLIKPISKDDSSNKPITFSDYIYKSPQDIKPFN